jgi:hypothetical protein
MFSVLARQLPPSFLRPNVLPSIFASNLSAALPLSSIQFRSQSNDSDPPQANDLSLQPLHWSGNWGNIRTHARTLRETTEEHIIPDPNQVWQTQSEQALGPGIPAHTYTGS